MKAFIDSIASISGLPIDMINGYRYIVFNGAGIFIEGIRGIRSLNGEEISIALKRGILNIRGNGLVVKHLNRDEILISGSITEVSEEK